MAALADDPVLGPLVRARPHLRVPGSTDPFETAVLVVLGQHVSLAAGRVFAARLVAAHGTDQLEGLRAFPGPEVLAALDPMGLQRTVGLTGARAKTVVEIARAVTEGTLDAMGDAETRQRLLAIPGAGRGPPTSWRCGRCATPTCSSPATSCCARPSAGDGAPGGHGIRGLAATPLPRRAPPVDPPRHRPAALTAAAAPPAARHPADVGAEHRQWCGAPLPRRGDRAAHPEAG